MCSALFSPIGRISISSHLLLVSNKCDFLCDHKVRNLENNVPGYPMLTVILDMGHDAVGSHAMRLSWALNRP